jgi:uncharacterized protein YlxP (DUF503 family)
MLHIAVLTLRFHLDGCASLKEKRQRLAGLRDRFGRQPNIAVCESDNQDVLQSAEWSFVVAAGSRALVDRTIADVETFVAESVDARVAGRELEYA